MKNVVKILQKQIANVIELHYQQKISPEEIQIEKTHQDFEGDLTWIIFPLLKKLRQSPDQIGAVVGNELLTHENPLIARYVIIKGFCNFVLSDHSVLELIRLSEEGKIPEKSETVMVEFASPNTNKPLHLGHIRNILLGWSISELFRQAGYKVIRANLINDRGIHICKSMVAWKLFSGGETPASAGIKGDHLVGKYYVIFEQEYKKQVAERMASGMSEEEARQEAPLMQQARMMLQQWESGDAEVLALWNRMNQWVYEGFDETFRHLGIYFDEIYYESRTYLLGKKAVEEGLRKGVFYQKSDGSVWCDLTAEGLDHKLLLRSDGTSVYITQDIGTAIERFNSHPSLDRIIYVVGNEQEYHFKVLFAILKRLGYTWAERCYHLSYGMVELPEGKMKSREGTVVDADDLIAEMVEHAREVSLQLGKVEELNTEERQQLFRKIGLAALKYFILKVDPKKNMVFNPKESIELNGHTGPFIQYTHARISSLLEKAGKPTFVTDFFSAIRRQSLMSEERALCLEISAYKDVLEESLHTYNVSLLANYLYELARKYNHFYQTIPVLREADELKKQFRLYISAIVREILYKGMSILGIEMPEKM